MSVTLNASTSSGLVQTADTSGNIELQSNGTTKLSVLSTGVSGTLVQGTAVASTSGTSIDFTSIPSWVKRITVMFSGVSTSGTSVPLIQVGTSGGVVSSGYLASASNITTVVASSNYTTGIGVASTWSASVIAYGQIILALRDNNVWITSGSLGRSDSAGTFIFGGGINAGGTLDRIRITTVNGTDTFDAGSINIQYEG